MKGFKKSVTDLETWSTPNPAPPPLLVDAPLKKGLLSGFPNCVYIVDDGLGVGLLLPGLRQLQHRHGAQGQGVHVTQWPGPHMYVNKSKTNFAFFSLFSSHFANFGDKLLNILKLNPN